MSGEIRHEVGALLVDQLDAFEGAIISRDLARDFAVQLENDCARLTERLRQLRGVAFHSEGDGALERTCLLCGESWPCVGYTLEVSDWMTS